MLSFIFYGGIIATSTPLITSKKVPFMLHIVLITENIFHHKSAASNGSSPIICSTNIFSTRYLVDFGENLVRVSPKSTKPLSVVTLTTKALTSSNLVVDIRISI